jgi:hypothetical protein
MIYVLAGFSFILLALNVAQYVAHLRVLDKERSASAAREISLLNRIQAPEIAVAQSLPEPEGLDPLPIDDSPFADAAYAEYLERNS